ncbi:sodium:calcium antiporter [Salimicrobium jeotgali]|uniref:Na+/Ca2+ antiporter family protein n=2 Tax=Salimicrobium TaxID=351195 RepID=K2GL77_9BACI|nr:MULTISPECIES: sodium:calcium antiporter [Salimicrobium]AKG05416.1 sodium:calcium antiporter [Salimicrobium jeotgali]EKE31119.1 Na+/Ca2+ antiporter family protein [Salimicrobium jeotgali]MBM7697281.1 cation:H+ antiporter [Salimicrobium jeotgali]SIS85129.1 cation:H+ antiporter [Salimicrobium salexigens]
MAVLIFLGFFVSAIATFFIASNLAVFGDAVKEKTKATSTFVGAVIGIAISLPELTSSVTAVFIDTPGLAVGNLIGSNLFNLLGLAVFDIIYRKHEIMTRTTVESKLYAYLVIFLTMIVIVAVAFPLPTPFLHVSYSSVALVLFYAVGARFINKRTEYKGRKVKNEKKQERYRDYTKKQVLTRFISLSVAIMVMGSILTITAEEIAQITGLGSSFIGAFLVAISTSLPDASSVGTALKMRNYNLAISSLIGSNAFNILILAITDVMYFRGNLFSESSRVNVIVAVASVVFVLLFLISISRKNPKYQFTYMIPSFLIIILYFAVTFFSFQMK